MPPLRLNFSIGGGCGGERGYLFSMAWHYIGRAKLGLSLGIHGKAQLSTNTTGSTSILPACYNTADLFISSPFLNG
jgi:hypothetical protein